MVLKHTHTVKSSYLWGVPGQQQNEEELSLILFTFKPFNFL